MKDDSLIEQWKAADRKMVMFGDDTWIKLFPRHFARSDGTTSFFVSDYTEVSKGGCDYNTTIIMLRVVSAAPRRLISTLRDMLTARCAMTIGTLPFFTT